MSYTGFVQAGIQIGLQSILVKPKRGFFNIQNANGTTSDDIIAHATIEENYHDEIEITEHPLEQGAPISDHAYSRPAEIALYLGWSNSPNKDSGLIAAGVGAITANNETARAISNAAGIISGAVSLTRDIQASLNGTAVGQMVDIYNKLRQLQSAKAIFDLYTGKRMYTNMMIKIISSPNDYKTENAFFATVLCKQVIIVNTQAVSLIKDVQVNPAETASSISNGIKSALPSKPIWMPNLKALW